MNSSDAILEELFSSIESKKRRKSRCKMEKEGEEEESAARAGSSSSSSKKRHKKGKKKSCKRRDSSPGRRKSLPLDVIRRREDGRGSGERGRGSSSSWRRGQEEEERPPVRHHRGHKEGEDEDVFWDSTWDALQLQKKAEDQERKGRHYLDRERRRRRSPAKREDKRKRESHHSKRKRSPTPESEELKRLKKLKEVQELVVKDSDKYVSEPLDPNLFEWNNVTKMWKRKLPKSEYTEELRQRVEEHFKDKRKENEQKDECPKKDEREKTTKLSSEEMTLDEIEELKSNNDGKEGSTSKRVEEKEDDKEEGELRSDDEKDEKRRDGKKDKRSHSRKEERRSGRSSESRSRRHSSSRVSRRRSSSRTRRHCRESRHYTSVSKSRRRSRSRTTGDGYFRSSRSEIDKEKLLAIAKKNAVKLLSSDNLMGMDQDRLLAIKSGGQSLSQLTQFCRELAKKGITDEFSDDGRGKNSDSDSEYLHHPFVVKDRPIPNPISFSGGINGTSSGPEPLNSAARMAAKSHRMLEFPVSSGNAHRVKEALSVEQKEEEDGENNTEAKIEEESIDAPEEETTSQTECLNQANPVGVLMFSGKPETLIEDDSQEKISETTETDSVFENVDAPKMDIGSIVTQRLNAMRKLSENPNDPEALREMYTVQKEMSNWAQSKNKPGQFTGHTGAKVLSKGELSTGIQAWARQEQFTSAQKVSGGFGEFMLRKMGWNEGEGLGKDKSGDVDPLTLDIKMDKKGLMSAEEGFLKKKKGSVLTMTACKDLSCKHPVSALMELATKRRWGPPNFMQAFECGPPHKKQYIYKVTVDGVEYQPSIACDNKKKAKSDAATFALQEMGLLPKDPNNPL